MQSKTILTIACFMALYTVAGAQDKSTEKDVLTIYKGDHSYKEVSVAGKTTEVYVDEKRVADSEAPHYDSLIQVMRTDVDGDNRDRDWGDRMDRDEERAERNQRQAEREQQRAEGQQEEAERRQDQAERNQEQAERNQQQAERDQQQVERRQQQAERDQQQVERRQQQAERDRDRAERDQENRERVQAVNERTQADNDRVQAKFDRIQAKFDRVQAKEERASFRNLIQFLVDQHIVADRDHLSALVLTDTALYVNGVKQPQAIHQTLKEQYSHWAQCGLSYGDSQAPGTSMFFSRRYYSGCCE